MIEVGQKKRRGLAGRAHHIDNAPRIRGCFFGFTQPVPKFRPHCVVCGFFFLPAAWRGMAEAFEGRLAAKV